MSGMVKLLNVTFQHGGVGNGVYGVSLAVAPCEFVLLVGKTGAGKTTLLKLISLEITPAAGEIVLDSYKSSEIKYRQLPLWRRRLGIVYQDFRLLRDRSALENVRLAAACESNLPGGPKERALKALGRTGLSHKIHSRPDELSTGEQQRVAIARALVNEPFLLLADEPVSNLDEETASEIVELLRKINQSGTAILVATHQLEHFAVCHTRIIKLHNGSLVES